MVNLSYPWFRSLLLLGLFFVMFMHAHSCAYAYQGKGIQGVKENIVADKKELVYTQKTRKMVIVVHKFESEKRKEGATSTSSKISEKGRDAVVEKTLTKAQDQFHHPQKNSSGENKVKDDEERRELKELVNLMHKDYARFGRRKPPINNNEPRH